MQARPNVIALPQRPIPASKLRRDAPMKRSRADRVLILVFALFLCYVGLTVARQEIRLLELRRQLQAVSAEQQHQLQEMQRLEEELQSVRSDRYIERVARDKLGLLKPGDFFYLVGKSDSQP